RVPRLSAYRNDMPLRPDSSSDSDSRHTGHSTPVPTPGHLGPTQVPQGLPSRSRSQSTVALFHIRNTDLSGVAWHLPGHPIATIQLQANESLGTVQARQGS